MPWVDGKPRSRLVDVDELDDIVQCILVHFRGAINNGLAREELRTVLHQITGYCDVPAGVECFRIARKIFAETDR